MLQINTKYMSFHIQYILLAKYIYITIQNTVYKLNSNNILTPITDIGECDQVKVPEMIKQGSVLGSVISAITIDSLTRILDSDRNIWEIEGTKIKPFLFQDDIIAINKTKAN